MKYQIHHLILFGLIFFLSPSYMAWTKDPKSLIADSIAAMGGKSAFYAKKDVSYTYIYRDNKSGLENISEEKYLFDGELSWGKYHKYEKFVIPGKEGEVIQVFDGINTYVTLDGKLINDPKVVKMAEFTRKTNYYWFAMMFKLLDPGLIYLYEGEGVVNGIQYDKVKITFEEGVGDAKDIYLVYINRKTKLIDQFLFTVMDFGKKDPLLMMVEYEAVDGIKLPARRKYTQSNWNAEPYNDLWVDEISKNITFNTGLTREFFQKP
ncbi:MAG: hypothetical protein AAGA18_06185 [Verrucomicrobiota bacterium]